MGVRSEEAWTCGDVGRREGGTRRRCLIGLAQVMAAGQARWLCWATNQGVSTALCLANNAALRTCVFDQCRRSSRLSIVRPGRTLFD